MSWTLKKEVLGQIPRGIREAIAEAEDDSKEMDESDPSRVSRRIGQSLWYRVLGTNSMYHPQIASSKLEDYGDGKPLG